MKIGDIVRLEAGSVEFIESESGCPQRLQKLTGNIKAHACRCNATVKTGSIRGFNFSGQPVYLVRVEVIKQGSPKQKRGRPRKTETAEA